MNLGADKASFWARMLKASLRGFRCEIVLSAASLQGMVA